MGNSSEIATCTYQEVMIVLTAIGCSIMVSDHNNSSESWKIQTFPGSDQSAQGAPSIAEIKKSCHRTGGYLFRKATPTDTDRKYKTISSRCWIFFIENIFRCGWRDHFSASGWYSYRFQLRPSSWAHPNLVIYKKKASCISIHVYLWKHRWCVVYQKS